MRDQSDRNWFAEIFGGVSEVFRGAPADIRHNVVERPWFGRAVTPPEGRTMSEALGWSSHNNPLPTEQDRSHGIDR